MQSSIVLGVKMRKRHSLVIIFWCITIAFFFSWLIPAVDHILFQIGMRLLGKNDEFSSLWRHRFLKHSIRMLILLSAIPVLFRYARATELQSMDEKSQQGRRSLLWCFGSAFVVLSICSTCSPLYPVHMWDDSNCFFTVGKSIWKGLVPYRDLHEQKGPILFFLHSCASLISYRTFHGVFLFEIVAAAIFLWLTGKTVSLFTKRNCWPFIALFSSCVYSSFNFVLGDSVEELILPLFAYVMYVSLKHTKEHSLYLSKELFFFGLIAGVVFWTKFNLLGFFIGWAVGPIIQYSRLRLFRQIVQSLLLVLCGVIVVSGPILLFFGINDALSDLFNIYFYNNILLYPQKLSLFQKWLTLFSILREVYFYNYGMLLLQILALIAWIKLGRPYLLQMLCMYCVTFFTIFFGGSNYAYYSFLLWVFTGLSFLPLLTIIPAKIDECWAWYAFSLGAALVFAYLNSDSARLLGIPKEQYPQYTFSLYINEKADRGTLMNYQCLDQGIFTISGALPTQKYFFTSNINNKEQEIAQEEVLKKGLVDFIITDTPIESSIFQLVMCQEKPLWRKRQPTLYLYEKR